MRAECLVSLCLVLLGIAFQVAEGGRETVAAVFPRCPAEGPESVLQSLGQGDEALAPEHHLGVLPAGERQTKVIEPMRERLAGDADAQFRSIGEVGQALLPGRMSLAEDHLPLWAMQRLPGAH